MHNEYYGNAALNPDSEKNSLSQMAEIEKQFNKVYKLFSHTASSYIRNAFPYEIMAILTLIQVKIIVKYFDLPSEARYLMISGKLRLIES